MAIGPGTMLQSNELVFSTAINVSVQLAVPAWVQARALGTYLMTFQGGMALGSIGAFLVLEDRNHAAARGAKPLARLCAVRSERVRRRGGAISAELERLWGALAPHGDRGEIAVVSGATGCEPATAEELQKSLP